MVYTTLMTVKRKIQELVTQAGIYHNPSLWLISYSTDWQNWTTIADNDLWAIEVYDWWEITENNSWNLYQFWNNYPFPKTESVIDTSTTQVDASQYWPNNYYNSLTFIISTDYRDSSKNSDLRWWNTNTLEARRWPCSEWFHVPSRTEFNSLKNSFSSLWNDPYLFKLKAWNFLMLEWREWWYKLDVNYWYYYTSDVNSSWTAYVARVWTWTPKISLLTWTNCNWINIRPFKNESVQPDTSRTVLYQSN